jgi:hypothetical protein
MESCLAGLPVSPVPGGEWSLEVYSAEHEGYEQNE